jgi:hypothetical protein
VYAAPLTWALRDAQIRTVDLARLSGLSNDTICSVRAGKRQWVTGATATKLTAALDRWRAEQATADAIDPGVPDSDSESAA